MILVNVVVVAMVVMMLFEFFAVLKIRILNR